MRMLSVSIGTVALMALAAANPADAQDAPRFVKETFPERGVEATWQEFQALSGPDTELDVKTKELIGLAVAAQIPCDYCVYYHTEAAKQQGATDEEIKEAVAAAALTRKWSTMLQGSDYDEDAWRQEVDAMFSGQ